MNRPSGAINPCGKDTRPVFVSEPPARRSQPAGEALFMTCVVGLSAFSTINGRQWRAEEVLAGILVARVQIRKIFSVGTF